MRPRTLLLAALAALPLGGCLGGIVGNRPEGVLPAEDIGPPPSLRAPTAARPPEAAPAPRRTAAREGQREGQRLSVPDGTARATPGTSASERKFRREDLEDYAPSSGGGGPSVAPVISSGGGAGIGGRF